MRRSRTRRCSRSELTTRLAGASASNLSEPQSACQTLCLYCGVWESAVGGPPYHRKGVRMDDIYVPAIRFEQNGRVFYAAVVPAEE